MGNDSGRNDSGEVVCLTQQSLAWSQVTSFLSVFPSDSSFTVPKSPPQGREGCSLPLGLCFWKETKGSSSLLNSSLQGLEQQGASQQPLPLGFGGSRSLEASTEAVCYALCLPGWRAWKDGVRHACHVQEQKNFKGEAENHTTAEEEEVEDRNSLGRENKTEITWQGDLMVQQKQR